MNNLQNKNILIIGLGIIGGSYAKGFKAEGILPYGYDIDERTLEIAKELGIIHEETDLITNIQKIITNIEKYFIIPLVNELAILY